MLARVLFRTLLRNIHADHTAQEALVRTSSMDWTIVRAAILTDDPASGNVTATNTGKMGRIGRADGAQPAIPGTVCLRGSRPGRE